MRKTKQNKTQLEISELVTSVNVTAAQPDESPQGQALRIVFEKLKRSRL